MNVMRSWLSFLILLPRIELIQGSSKSFSPLFLPRGGASVATAGTTGTTNDSESRAILQQYRMQQSHLLQLRSTFLSEALSSRGISIGPTLTEVATPEGLKPPQETDWDCCISTINNPKSCLYSFDAEPNTKVVCPINSHQYISLKALNRLRRTDPTKVEPMWHSQYAILNSWFHNSQYSLMQFIGWKGFFVSNILLDLGNGMALRSLLALGCLAVLGMAMPVLEIIIGRFLTCSPLWMKWMSWGRFVHAALPLKILIGQMAWKFLAGSFGKLETYVRDYIVELECTILEESIPVTMSEDDNDEEIDNDDNDSDVFDNDDGEIDNDVFDNDDNDFIATDGDAVIDDKDSMEDYDSDNDSEEEYDFDEDDY